MSGINNLPPQLLPFNRKNKEWRKKHLDWAEGKSFHNYSLVRKSVLHKKINQDLINGILHKRDMELVLNPDHVSAGYIPDEIQHYPIINSKLNVLRGEESKRIYDYRVIITNPNSISEIENTKKLLLLQSLQEEIQNTSQNEEEFNARLEKINHYYTYEWLDLREIRANALLNHYSKEYNFPLMFNQGFMDAMVNAEEMYLCDIISGEPVVEKLNPMKVRVFRSGYSNKVEDADIVVIEDYWNPGKIIDNYYDVLDRNDIKYIEKIETYNQSGQDEMDNYDERDNFVLGDPVDYALGGGIYFDPLSLFGDTAVSSNAYHDGAGNIRVLRVYWKSKRKIKKVKSYDPETGEEQFNFYPETYKVNKALGEEEETFWINEAWEGTKIGKEIYVNMRPRVVQYNRLSNPSRCHFGIIGSIYNFNDSKPFSLVDMMKPYNYLYNAIHDRLNKAIAANWGKIVKMDLALIPKGWDVERWLHYAKINKIAVTDSFKEGNIGAATGKLAGAMNNNSSGVIDAETGNFIQQHVQLLDFIKMEMAEVAGISKQREGLISNRETVGGIERATLQSSHITEWLFFTHEDVKKRVLECFLETAKIALKGRNKKFQYILSDASAKIMDLDGDEFAEHDYGLAVDNSQGSQKLNEKLDILALAALQNLALSFSAIMKLYSSNSIAEKQRLVESNEQEMIERNQQAQQAEMEAKQAENEAKIQSERDKIQAEDTRNIRDNETKLLIALMQQFASEDTSEDVDFSPEAKAQLLEKIREFNEKLALDKEKLKFDKEKHQDDVKLKNRQISKLVNKSQANKN